MNDGLPEDVVTLAKEYLDSLRDEDGINDDLEEAEEEIEYWEEQIEEFEEGTPMHEMAVEERDGWREKIEAIDTREKRREEFSEELLTRASTEFAPQDDWLNEVVIEALSHALIGRRQERILVEGFKIPEDRDELSKRDMVEVAKTVQALAKDAVGEDDRMTKLWEQIDTETQRTITRVLDRHQKALPASRISDEIGEDGTDNPGSNIRYLRGEVDIQPYYSTNDGYALSLAGRYVWREYGPGETKPEDTAVTDEQDGTGENENDGVPQTGDEGVKSGNDASGEAGNEVDLSSFDVQE